MNVKQEIVEFEKFVSELVVGQRCNVRRDPNDAPMVREITFAGREKRHDGEWIAWRWKSEGKTPEGNVDCGFSGYHVTYALRQQANEIMGLAGTLLGGALGGFGV